MMPVVRHCSFAPDTVDLWISGGANETERVHDALAQFPERLQLSRRACLLATDVTVLSVTFIRPAPRAFQVGLLIVILENASIECAPLTVHRDESQRLTMLQQGTEDLCRLSHKAGQVEYCLAESFSDHLRAIQIDPACTETCSAKEAELRLADLGVPPWVSREEIAWLLADA